MRMESKLAAMAVCLWVVPFGTASAFTVDAEMPAGNVVVEDVAGDAVRLRPDLRDTTGDWFYWAFRVKGAKGRTLAFEFSGAYGGEVVGVRGPAVTVDGGRTWSYPCDGRATTKSFAYTFDTDGEVRFCSTWQYLPADWEAFLARHAAARGRVFEPGVLCRSRKGAAVPCARFGRLDGKPRYRALVTSRHHAGEAPATAALEGLAAAFLADDDLGQWLRANVELTAVPFVDYDGVVAGDQGKNRAPHDHNRDYAAFLYPETRALADLAGRPDAASDVWLDLHCPWIRGGLNERVHAPLKRDVNGRNAAAERRFDALLERHQLGALRYRALDDLPYGTGWNVGGNYAKGLPAVYWALENLPNLRLGHTLEIPFANAGGVVVTPASCRAFGRDLAQALRAFLDMERLPREVELDIPTTDSGALDLVAATVKDEYANPLDVAKGAKIDLSKPSAPSLTTAPTVPGLVYTLREGATLDTLADGVPTVGDGQPWKPALTVKGGASGFYTIRVSK